jgi:hypothetical protein
MQIIATETTVDTRGFNYYPPVAVPAADGIAEPRRLGHGRVRRRSEKIWRNRANASYRMSVSPGFYRILSGAPMSISSGMPCGKQRLEGRSAMKLRLPLPVERLDRWKPGRGLFPGRMKSSRLGPISRPGRRGREFAGDAAGRRDQACGRRPWERVR